MGGMLRQVRGRVVIKSSSHRLREFYAARPTNTPATNGQQLQTTKLRTATTTSNNNHNSNNTSYHRTAVVATAWFVILGIFMDFLLIVQISKMQFQNSQKPIPSPRQLLMRGTSLQVLFLRGKAPNSPHITNSWKKNFREL